MSDSIGQGPVCEYRDEPEHIKVILETQRAPILHGETLSHGQAESMFTVDN